MQKLFNKFNLLFIIMTTIIYPQRVFALAYETPIYTINDKEDFIVEDLKFESISFFSDLNEKVFGIEGKFYNNNNQLTDFSTTASFYNKNNHLLAEITYNKEDLIKNDNNFLYKVSERSIESGYQITDIYYYSLTIKEKKESSESYLNKKKDNLFIFNTKIKINTIYYTVCVIPIIFLLISIALWYKFGKNENVIETIEMYPPKALNSLEVAFYNRGIANKRDVTSLLIYLANKGYLKISSLNKDTSFTKNKEFKITKIKEYDGNNLYEQKFLEGLFQMKKTSSLENKKVKPNEILVTSRDFQKNFYHTIIEILKDINNTENRNKIYEKNSIGKRKIIIFMIIITYLLITIIPVIKYKSVSIEISIISTILSLLSFSILLSIITIKFPKILKIISIICFGSIAIFPTIAITLPALPNNTLNLIGYIIGISSIVVMFVLANLIRKRTAYNNEILGKIKSFRKFLKTINEDKIEKMLQQDPNYLYNILPYAYVLGLSNNLIKKLENINIQSPLWYKSQGKLNITSLNNLINNMILSTSDIMQSN